MIDGDDNDPTGFGDIKNQIGKSTQQPHAHGAIGPWIGFWVAADQVDAGIHAPHEVLTEFRAVVFMPLFGLFHSASASGLKMT
jgi:hypothetical protein